jgi:lysophospholipase L1-like esterase
MKLILLTLTFVSFSFFTIAQSLPDSLYPPDTLSVTYHSAWTKTHYIQKINEFKKAPLAMNDIVFLGNSITAQAGDWGKRLGWRNVKNRGISGDVTEGVLKRLGEITYSKPKAVFLLIGINDISNAASPEYIAGNILGIAKAIRNASPKTKVYVQTILPTSTLSKKQKIQQTNALIKKNVHRKTYALLNIHDLFADEADLIKKEYTSDGLHLSEKGYTLWAEYLKKKFPKLSN